MHEYKILTFLAAIISDDFFSCSCTERVLPLELSMLELLQQWGTRRPEVSFYLRHWPAWPSGTETWFDSHDCYQHCSLECLLIPTPLRLSL